MFEDDDARLLAQLLRKLFNEAKSVGKEPSNYNLKCLAQSVAEIEQLDQLILAEKNECDARDARKALIENN